MSIAGASASLIRMLRTRYAANHGGDLQGLTFSVVSAAELSETIVSHVTLFLYRVDPDVTRRHQELPPTTATGPARRALVLDLRYLLTVWGRNAEREQQILGECMAILDENPVLAGDALDGAYTWNDGANLRIALDHLGTEDMLRLWDVLTPSFRLSIPYVVRTTYLPAHTLPSPAPVSTATQVLVPGVHS